MLEATNIPWKGNTLVRFGGAGMALSTLFSWLETGQDGFPNVSGIGASTFGVGLTVFLVGLSLLLRRKSIAVTLGMALGAFAITMIYIVLISVDTSLLGLGAWLGMVGSSVAVLGAVQMVFEPEEQLTMEFQPLPTALGSILAVTASFWLDWVDGPLNGLNSEVLFGIPVLIMAGIALAVTVHLVTVPHKVTEGLRQTLLAISHSAGFAILVIAGSNVLGLILGNAAFGSGPLVALVGGVMLTRSISQH
ncbi:hypothetical protein [Candidatus Poriferisocius sp.]|uniref:hypothetical protein n=1 Tax=Candidatus Poriferisocius sp. TaxID=3101276 RepID=UPI003B012BE7